MKKLFLGLTAAGLCALAPLPAFSAPAQTGEMAFYAGDYANARPLLSQEANQGNAGSAYYLGLMYKEGYGVQQSQTQAITWFSKAANSGHGEAQAELGYAYKTGTGVTQSDKLSADWYEKAAIGGNNGAMVSFAHIFETGKGRPQSLDNAKFWYKRAAGLGNEVAKKRLPEIQTQLKALANSGRVKPDGFYDQPSQSQKPVAKPNALNDPNTTSVKPLPKIILGAHYSPRTKRKSSDSRANLADGKITQNFNDQRYTDVRGEALTFAMQGMARYQLIVGKTYFNEKNYSEAMRWYKRAAAAEDTATAFSYVSEAQYLVGALYDYGLGVRENRNLAAGWYALASNHILPEKRAAFELGQMYETGKYIPQDDDKAIKYYAKAGSENGEALFRKGYIYEKNVPKNLLNKRFALEAYEKSAAAGNAHGQFALGMTYFEGKLTDKSMAKALEWLKKSAVQEYPDAQTNLGLIYVNGFGTPKNLELGKSWLQKAAAQDYQKAKDILQQLGVK